MSDNILDGIKVVEAASFVAGPSAAVILADFGADVIKVEPPGRGDPYRGGHLRGDNPRSDYPYSWIVDNRSKKGIALDLKNEAGREVLDRLLADADVFITNMPQSARASLRLDYDDIAAVNDRIVYAAISAYGETGPEAARTGFDSTALWARTGLMDLCKPAPDSAPARSLPGMGDHPTGVSLVAAIMMGLFRRERTGKGSKVWTSLMANGLWWNAILTQARLCGATVKARPSREDAANALHNLYRTADGRWMHIVAYSQVAREGGWQNFANSVGRPELGTDPRFDTADGRRDNVRALIAELDAALGAHDMAHWRQRLVEGGVTFGEIRTVDDIPDDPQMVAGGALVPIDDPRAGAPYTVSSPFWVEGVDKRPPTLAPDVGADTDAVLRGYGYDTDAIAALRAAGAIG